MAGKKLAPVVVVPDSSAIPEVIKAVVAPQEFSLSDAQQMVDIVTAAPCPNGILQGQARAKMLERFVAFVDKHKDTL